jgi:hypothetical protein
MTATYIVRFKPDGKGRHLFLGREGRRVGHALRRA